VPDQVDDATIHAAIARRLADISAGKLTASKRPRVWISESSTFDWCVQVGAAGGFRKKGPEGMPILKTPAELPPTLTSGGTTPDAIAKRITDVLSWGVQPGDIAAAPYEFSWANRSGFAELRASFPTLFPVGYIPARGAPNGDGFVDYPDAVMVAADVACFGQWLKALRAQQPAIGLVVAQLSNGGGAFGFGGAGYGIAAGIARAQVDSGFPVAMQVEAFACPENGPCNASSWHAAADCAMWCAAHATKAQVSVFSGDLWAAAGNTLGACSC
jgi:hypothetical protein